MADGIEFIDNRAQVQAAMEDAISAFLVEIGGEVQAQVVREYDRNNRVKTGQTKGSWDYKVDESEHSVTIGSPLENAIWEEFGTGEYALNGDGRKGGWFYVDEQGKGHFTHGKTPNRALHNAIETTKPKLQSALEAKLKGMG